MKLSYPLLFLLALICCFNLAFADWSSSPRSALAIYDGSADNIMLKPKPVMLGNGNYLVMYYLQFYEPDTSG